MTLSPRQRDLLLLFALCGLCFFWRLGAVGLFDFNEGLYVAAAREMYLRGDYITARVNGAYFFDKPPLALWCAALSFHLFGVNEFAARFPVALAASLLTFLTYGFGARFFGRCAGLLSAFLLALSPMLFATARQMTMDIHQSLWIAVAMVCFFQGVQVCRCAGVHRCAGVQVLGSRFTPSLWFYGFWAACGLGVLAKSVPGLLPIPAAFVYVCLRERFRARPILRRIREAKPLVGIPLLLLIIAPWHILAYQANGPIFFQEFWLKHHVQLFNGTNFDHVEPFWFYLPALFVGFFPWSVFLPCALWKANRGSRCAEPPDTEIPPSLPEARLFALVWAAVVCLSFSAMSSKLISYLLPMYPAAALLVGDWMAQAREGRQARGLKFGVTAVALLITAGLIGGAFALASPSAQRHVPAPVADWMLHGLLLVTAGTLLTTLLVWRSRCAQGIGALVGTMAAFVALGVTNGLNVAERTLNAPLHALAREGGARLSEGIPLAIHIAGPRRPSVLFYLPASVFVGRPLPPAGETFLLERGEKPPIDAFLTRHRPAYVLTDAQRADALLCCTRGLVVAERRDRWALLRAEPLQGAERLSPVASAHLAKP